MSKYKECFYNICGHLGVRVAYAVDDLNTFEELVEEHEKLINKCDQLEKAIDRAIIENQRLNKAIDKVVKYLVSFSCKHSNRYKRMWTRLDWKEWLLNGKEW